MENDKLKVVNKFIEATSGAHLSLHKLDKLARMNCVKYDDLDADNLFVDLARKMVDERSAVSFSSQSGKLRYKNILTESDLISCIGLDIFIKKPVAKPVEPAKVFTPIQPSYSVFDFKQKKRPRDFTDDVEEDAPSGGALFQFGRKKKKQVAMEDEDDAINYKKNYRQTKIKLARQEEPDVAVPGFRSAIEDLKSNYMNAINKDSVNCQQSQKQNTFVPPYKKAEQILEKHEKKTELDKKLKNYDPKIIECIESDILDSSPNVKWSDIAGLERAKSDIKEIMILPLKRPDLYKGIRKPPKVYF